MDSTKRRGREPSGDLEGRRAALREARELWREAESIVKEYLDFVSETMDRITYLVLEWDLTMDEVRLEEEPVVSPVEGLEESVEGPAEDDREKELASQRKFIERHGVTKCPTKAV